MRYQEAFSRSKPWDWLLGPFRSRSAEETPATSIIESEEAIRDEVEEALERFGIDRPSYRLRLLMCPITGSDGQELIVGPEEWILCVTLTLKTGDLVSAMTRLEKYLHRRLARYAIRVRAIYWRMAAA
jgi:hypothetical protein